ncbi:MAG: HlyD family efflux transporter periplasmic adaptor subunit [Sedimentisphaerales bacterium]
MNKNQLTNPQTTYKFLQGKRKWLIAVGCACGAIVLFMVFAADKTPSTEQSPALNTFKARVDKLTVTVTESGSIKARKSIDLKSEVEGRATIVNIVPEGIVITSEDVNNGKVLVELDSGDLKEQLTQRQIDYTTAESGYAEANEAYAIQVKQNESDITAAQLKVRFALMDFKKYVGENVADQLISDVVTDPNSTRNIPSLLDDPNKFGRTEASQKLTDFQDQIELAGSRLAKAQYKLEGTQQLFDANYVSELELQGDDLDKRSCEIQNKQARVNLDLFKLYDFPKQAEKLLSDYYEANRELDRTYAKARSQLAQKKSILESAKARLDLQEDRLNKSKKQFAACTMKAPGPGLVVYGSSQDPFRRFGGSSSGMIAAGEQVYQQQVIITLPDTSEMIAEITVHESSVDKVKPDQKATIVMDAFQDKTFEGKVVKVATLPDQQRGWLSPDVKVYTTQVSIEGTHAFLKPGMSARVTIFVDEVPDALIVPVQVVANRGGKKICFVANNGKSTEREIKTGLFNDTHVEVLEGLQPGEEVMLNPPRITETKVEQPRTAGKFQRPGQPKDVNRDSGPAALVAGDQPRPAEPTASDPAMRDPNRAGRRPQNMAFDPPAGGFPFGGGNFDPNKMDEQTRERIRQFRERAARGEMPAFDPNQMDEQTKERFRQFRNRMRQQNDDANSGQ